MEPWAASLVDGRELRFLDSNENYQAAKNFAHIGLSLERWNDGQRRRTAEFKWSRIKGMGTGERVYRRVRISAF